MYNISPSQTQDEFEEFCNDISLLLPNVNDANATLSVISSDFNAKLSKCWNLDKENAEGQETKSLTPACRYSKLINKPTHVTKESSTCIDLIFATSPNFIRKTGAELSIFEKCHQNLIYGVADFKVLLPPPYLTEIWNYKNANVKHMMMNCFCGMIDRRKAFSLISSRDNCQRSSPSRITDTP